MEVEFGWVGGVGWGGVQTHFHVKPNSVEVVLRLSQGCDNLDTFDTLDTFDIFDNLDPLDQF